MEAQREFADSEIHRSGGLVGFCTMICSFLLGNATFMYSTCGVFCARKLSVRSGMSLGFKQP